MHFDAFCLYFNKMAKMLLTTWAQRETSNRTDLLCSSDKTIQFISNESCNRYKLPHSIKCAL